MAKQLLVYFQCDDCGKKYEDWFSTCSCGGTWETTYVLCDDCDNYHQDGAKCQCK
jgi:predicted ATP-dependent serine protease